MANECENYKTVQVLSKHVKRVDKSIEKDGERERERERERVPQKHVKQRSTT